MAKYFKTYDFVADRNMVAANKSFSFRSYTDRVGVFGNPGSGVIYNDGSRSPSGTIIGKSFSLNQSHYKLQAREGQTDAENKTLYDFLRSAPFCYGSPNGTYVDSEGHFLPDVKISSPRELDKVWEDNLKKLRSGEIKQTDWKYKLLDTEADALVALETGLKRAEAQLSVGQLDEQTLREIAAMIGVFGKSEKMTRLDVYEWAGKKPLDYFKQLNSGDRPIRSVIRLAIEQGVLVTKGTVIYW